METIEIWLANPLWRTLPPNQWQALMDRANQHGLNQHVTFVMEQELEIKGCKDQMRIAELLWHQTETAGTDRIQSAPGDTRQTEVS